MKTLSGPSQTAVAKQTTQPGHLIEIRFATPLYLSTRGQVTFNGHTFVAADIRVSGIRQDARGSSGGQLTMPNGDLAWSALLLGEGIADKRILIWSFDGTATGAQDILPVFDGAGDSARIGQPCVVQLTGVQSGMAVSPRRVIGPPLFNHLSPRGRTISIGTATLTLERA